MDKDRNAAGEDRKAAGGSPEGEAQQSKTSEADWNLSDSLNREQMIPRSVSARNAGDDDDEHDRTNPPLPATESQPAHLFPAASSVSASYSPRVAGEGRSFEEQSLQRPQNEPILRREQRSKSQRTYTDFHYRDRLFSMNSGVPFRPPPQRLSESETQAFSSQIRRATSSRAEGGNYYGEGQVDQDLRAGGAPFDANDGEIVQMRSMSHGGLGPQRVSLGSRGDLLIEQSVGDPFSPYQSVSPAGQRDGLVRAERVQQTTSATNIFFKKSSSYTVIVYHSSMAPLAEKIQALYPGKIHIIGPTFEYFKDGWPNVAFSPEQVYMMQDSHSSVCFLASFHTPTLVFEQLAVLYALPKMLVRNFRIIVPWFSTGTMERVETMGQIATAKTLARVLDSTPNCRTGAPIITIYDIHTLQEQFYFNDNVLVELKSAVFLLKQELAKLNARLENEDEVDSEFAIAFPDDGAKKRFGSKFPEYPHIVISKQRLGEQRLCRIQDGNPKGKHVILVDDMVQSGGTLLESITCLVQGGATKVSCYVTHAVFPGESWRKFLPESLGKICSCFDTFYVCDTIPTTRDVLEKVGKPFKVLSIAPLVGYLLVGRVPGNLVMREQDKLDT